MAHYHRQYGTFEIQPLNWRYFRIADNTATDGLARSRAPISNPLTCMLVTRTYLEVHPG